MSSVLRSRRFLFAAAVVVLVVVVGAGAYFLWFAPGLPEPGSPRYQKYVEAFQVGVAVLDVGGPEPHEGAIAVDPTTPDLALQKLNEAVDTVPDEPAGWADRGLWYLRRHLTDLAAKDLRCAEQLAPDHPGIQNLLGLLAQAQGKYREAVGHFRKALEKNPRDLITLYTLTEALQQEVPQANDQERLKLFDEGLKVEPYNLRLLREKATVAAQLSDQGALAEAVAAYERIAPNWSGKKTAEEARDQLKMLETQAGGSLPGDVPNTVQVLDNLLQPEHNYVRDAMAVDRTDLRLGEPVEQFLRLKPMRATASPPDLGLTFDPASPPGDVTEAVARLAWDVTLPVWLTQGADPVPFVANAAEVRPVSAAGPAIAFPGGEKKTPPTAYGVLPVDWNNDYRTDLLLAGAGGLRFYQQGGGRPLPRRHGENGPRAKTLLEGDYFGAWAADVDMDGDLDLVVAPRDGAPLVLRNNGDGTFKALKPFPGVDGARDFAWADFDDDGAADAAFLDAQGTLARLRQRARAGSFAGEGCRPSLGKGLLALAVADVNDDGVLDLLVLASDGVVRAASRTDRGKPGRPPTWPLGRLSRTAAEPGVVPPAGRGPRQQRRPRPDRLHADGDPRLAGR